MIREYQINVEAKQITPGSAADGLFPLGIPVTPLFLMELPQKAVLLYRESAGKPKTR